MSKVFYFVDTREGAKSEKPFGIHNPDVAKTWTKDFNNGEGPFKPVDDNDYNLNYMDTKKSKRVELDNGKDLYLQTDDGDQYKNMKVEELQAELEARNLEFKAKDTKTELIEKLVADDNK